MNYYSGYLKQTVTPLRFYILINNYEVGKLNQNDITKDEIKNRPNN